jgi:hypothetical protein
MFKLVFFRVPTPNKEMVGLCLASEKLLLMGKSIPVSASVQVPAPDEEPADKVWFSVLYRTVCTAMIYTKTLLNLKSLYLAAPQ